MDHGAQIHPHAGPRPGEVIAGKYVIERVIGRGGMGTVMAAEHRYLGRRVAMKFVGAGAGDVAEVRTRFLREARILASMRSEHAVRVLDAGELPAGPLYLVMEHLEGADLGQVLRSGAPIPVQWAVDQILQAAAALAEAHALGVVHRDLKPSNLFVQVRPDGSTHLKVLDFGISKLLGPDGSDADAVTGTRVVVGSPQYMAPEQLSGSEHVDARIDVWSLGVVLYELLTGRRPFDGGSLQATCAKIAAEAPPDPRSLRPEIPAPLESALLTCLEKDRAQRFAGVAELARALAPFGSVRTWLAVLQAGGAPIADQTLVLPCSPIDPPVAPTIRTAPFVPLPVTPPPRSAARGRAKAGLLATAVAIVAAGTLALASVAATPREATPAASGEPAIDPAPVVISGNREPLVPAAPTADPAATAQPTAKPPKPVAPRRSPPRAPVPADDDPYGSVGVTNGSDARPSPPPRTTLDPTATAD